ncbi:hypothetical protein BJ170DRAFT_48925 [Xylariales sp. AK1849]|nr:hypothetical protein BJ170DRAFT_48925 [Xylariales sp. AK1849]
MENGDKGMIYDNGDLDAEGPDAKDAAEDAENVKEEANGEYLSVPVVSSDVIPQNHDRPKSKSGGNIHQASPSKPRLVVAIESTSSQAQSNNAILDSPTYRDTSRLRTRPESQATGSDASPAISPFCQELDGPSLQPKKKRGRPKGWRPGMSYAKLRGDPAPGSKLKKAPKSKTAAAQANGEVKRRGRPIKPPELSMREQYLRSNPRFRSFGCEWDEEITTPSAETTDSRCPAELQNMKTLRRHVFLIHGDMDPLICRWGKCAQREAPVEFVDEDTFRMHMQKAHFESYIWHMGDGIQNKGLALLKQNPNEIPAYLFDKDGNQVTPSVRDQQFEDTAGMLERKRRVRDRIRRAWEDAPEEQEYMMQTLHGTGALGA